MPTRLPLAASDASLGRDRVQRDDWRRVLGTGEVEELRVVRTAARARTPDRIAWDRQDFHTDGTDIVGLLCLQAARSEGLVQGDGVSGPHKTMQATMGNGGSASAEGTTSDCIG